MSRPGKGGARSGETTRRNFLKSAAAWGAGAPALARGAQGGAGGTILAYVGSYTLPAGPDGKFLYASNRLHDTIAWFSIGADGTLAWQGEEWTCGPC